MQESVFLAILPQEGGSGTLISLLFYLPFILLFLYGQKFQMQMSLFEISGIIKQLEKMKNYARKETIKVLTENGVKLEDAERHLDIMANYVTIMPNNMDPAGIVSKVDHILNVREAKWMKQVKKIVPNADEPTSMNIANLIEATAALDTVYRIVRHFYLLGKRTGNVYLIIQLQMILSLVMLEVRAYLNAIFAFVNGFPIGDGIGPLIAFKMTRKSKNKIIDISHETIVKKTELKGRIVYGLKAKGPGGNVGKPGEGIKNLVEKNKGKIKLIIMVDAALKLEGEKVGQVAEGVGAAIGGIGVEKFKIEAIASKYNIPLHAVIVKQSLNDAISVMRKEILDSTDDAIDKITQIILENTKTKDIVIVAGIGNSIGVAQ